MTGVHAAPAVLLLDHLNATEYTAAWLMHGHRRCQFQDEWPQSYNKCDSVAVLHRIWHLRNPVARELVQNEVQPPPPARHTSHQVLHKARVPAASGLAVLDSCLLDSCGVSRCTAEHTPHSTSLCC
jgi:hypothetical protein